jgi:hypothetical protein
MDGHHKELVDDMLATLGDKVANKDQVTPESPVGMYWEKGYQAVILYCDRGVLNDYNGQLWHPNSISSPWPNTGETRKLREKLQQNLEKRENNKFFVLQGILTPDGALIKKQLFETGGISIKSVASQCSCKVVDWVEDEWKGKHDLNVVIVDFFNDCCILPSVVNYNRK